MNWIYDEYIKGSIKESETLDDCHINLHLARETIANWGVEIYYAYLDDYARGAEYTTYFKGNYFRTHYDT